MAFFVDNTNEVVVPELTDQDGNAVTGATVEATLFEEDGKTKLTGITQPVSLADQGSGKYVGTVDEGISVSVGDVIKIKFVATKNNDQSVWWRTETARQR